MEHEVRERRRIERRKRGRDENPELRIGDWILLSMGGWILLRIEEWILLRKAESLLGREVEEVVGKGTMGCLLIFNSCKR